VSVLPNILFWKFKPMSQIEKAIVNSATGLFCHFLDEKRSHKRNRHRYRGIGIIQV